MSHKVLLLLALIGPILLIAAGGIAHGWGRRRKRPRAAEPEIQAETPGQGCKP